MHTILSIILAASSLIASLRANINEITLRTVDDPGQIEAYVIASDHGFENGADMRELFLRVPMTEAEFKNLADMQNGDGSFSDIDYADRHRGAWPVGIHCFRVQRMAIRYAQTGDRNVLYSALKAMRYWHAVMPVCPNWWHNEIGIPRLMGPAYLLLQDEMTEEDIDGAVAVMGKSSFKQTGQNKVWQAGNVLIRGIIQNDESLVSKARDVIASELHISDDVESLQPDWSFHQHGPQLQFGNYGLSYACSLSWWARAFEGTSLEFTGEQMDVLRGFVRNGLGQVVWNGWFDHNACGRQVFLNAQRGKAICVEEAARNLGVDLTYKKGGVYFPCSDFGVYRGRKWYASIRMQSRHIKGFETTNNENMKAYFSSDGALLLRRTGDEYNNISAVWNWKHIPGATTYDDGKDLYGGGNISDDADEFYNLSDRVSGKVRGRRMTVWMEYNRDSLTARKAWFFWKGGIVCLGAGISRESSDEVVTTIEQNHLQGKVKSGSNWVSHNGVTYVILDDNSYVLNNGPHKGSWRPISPTYPEDEVSEDLFEMYISHGRAPKDASYAYVIVPGGSQGKAAARRILRKVRVVENSSSRQVVKVGLRKFSVDWDGMN